MENLTTTSTGKVQKVREGNGRQEESKAAVQSKAATEEVHATRMMYLTTTTTTNRRTPMRIFIDMDGVIADFIGSACRWHNVENPYTRPDGPRGDEAWEVLDYINVEPRKFWSALGYNFWESMEPTSDGSLIVKAAEYLYGHQAICFLSSPCQTEGCAEGKRAWLEKHYPGYPLLLSVAVKNCAPPKSFVATADALLIDDSYVNVRKFVEAGGKGILVPRFWNRRHPDIDWAANYVATQLGAYCQLTTTSTRRI